MSAAPARVDGSPMEFLLKIRNDLVAEIPPGSAKYAIQYTSGWFIVWVEGRDEIVDAAVVRAGKELGNTQQIILHRSRGPARLRERILVSTTQTPLRPAEFGEWVIHMRDLGPKLEPTEIWNRLGAPSLVDSSKPGRRPARQVAFIAAVDHGPVDQLRLISERYASPIIYQRFGVAQLRSQDMGMAYVDIPSPAGPIRLRVFSGRALTRVQMRDRIPAMDTLVLLLGGSTAALVDVAKNLAAAIRPTDKVPQVWLAGAPGKAMDDVTAVLERSGIPSRALEAADAVSLKTVLPALGIAA